MDSELQWFSDSEIWSLFERGTTSYLYVSVLLLIWFSYSETWSPFEINYRFDAFLAHLSRRLIGELIVYQWSVVVVRPSSSSSSVVHNAQTSSSQKQLGRSKPNFMWSLLG